MPDSVVSGTHCHDCMNCHTVIILITLRVLFSFVCFFDMFHILLSGDSLRDLWNVYMYIFMYVCMYMMCVYYLLWAGMLALLVMF